MTMMYVTVVTADVMVVRSCDNVCDSSDSDVMVVCSCDNDVCDSSGSAYEV